MSFYNFVQSILGKILPKSWPWSTGSTAKSIVWICHVLIVVGAVAVAAWGLYALFAAAPPDGIEPQSSPEPLPLWIRAIKALAPLLAPFVTYGLYRYLPEPNGD